MGLIRGLYAIGRVGFGAGWALTKGVASTAADACRVINRLSNKDAEGAFEIVGQRIEKSIYGVANAIDNTLELAEEASEKKNKDFFREENIRKMTVIASLGVGSVVGVSLLDSDDSGDDSGFVEETKSAHLGQLGDVVTDAELASMHGLDPNAIENGTFVGNEADLQQLIKAGEDPNSVHIDSDSVNRDLGVRDAFLASKGFDSVPTGYEVHHIVPLSEGGSDTPDNMILVTEEDHDRITAAHRAYYGWNS